MGQEARPAFHYEHDGIDRQHDPEHPPMAFAQDGNLATLAFATISHESIFACERRQLSMHATNHLVAVGVEGIVDDPLCGIDLVIILEPQMPKSLGDGSKTRRLCPVP